MGRPLSMRMLIATNCTKMTWPSGPADLETLSLHTHCIIELAKNFPPWRQFIMFYARWILMQTPGHSRYRPHLLPARLELPIAYGHNSLGIPLIEIGHLRKAVDEYANSRNNLDNLAEP